jgi:protoporphyrinogen/coproporphyrinogen III oxidase
VSAPTRRLVVIGGGMTGLAAAWEAVQHTGVEVTLLEGTDRLGGKVRTSALDLPTGPLVVDEGADNFLARVPDAVALCRELGLGDELTTPRLGRARVWAGDRLRWFPQRHVLGVPLDADDLAATGILSAEGLAAAAAETGRTDPAPTDDVAIGPWLTGRFGRELVDHVVGPLVGGINAGDVDELSLRAVTPQLADAAAEGGSLTVALRRRVAAAPPSGPVFLGVRGGSERLVRTLADACGERGATLRTGVTVGAVERGTLDDDRPGWSVRCADGTSVAADAIVVTTPAPAAAALLRPVAAPAAELLDGIRHVPVAFVTFALRRDHVPVPLDASGLLVPRDAGMLATAVSWGSAKWAHWDDGEHVVLRTAAGHTHDDRPSRLDDDELVAGLRADLGTLMGITAPPVAARVTRWPVGFAQYTVGHLERVDRLARLIERDAPGVRVVGADLGGLGIPACIRQGREAARSLLR